MGLQEQNLPCKDLKKMECDSLMARLSNSTKVLPPIPLVLHLAAKHNKNNDTTDRQPRFEIAIF